MKTHLLSIVSVLVFALCLVIVFGNGRGTAGFSVALPVAGSSFTLDFHTAGWAAVGGFLLVILVLALLLANLIASFLALFRPRRVKAVEAKIPAPPPAPKANS